MTLARNTRFTFFRIFMKYRVSIHKAIYLGCFSHMFTHDALCPRLKANVGLLPLDFYNDGTLLEARKARQVNDTMSGSRIPVSRRTRDLVKAQKRGGQTYDELLREMVKQYNPDKRDTDLTKEM